MRQPPAVMLLIQRRFTACSPSRTTRTTCPRRPYRAPGAIPLPARDRCYQVRARKELSHLLAVAERKRLLDHPTPDVLQLRSLGEDRGSVGQVSVNVLGGARLIAGQQDPRVGEDDRVIVHVHDSRIRRDPPGRSDAGCFSWPPPVSSRHAGHTESTSRQATNWDCSTRVAHIGSVIVECAYD